MALHYFSQLFLAGFFLQSMKQFVHNTHSVLCVALVNLQANAALLNEVDQLLNLFSLMPQSSSFGN